MQILIVIARLRYAIMRFREPTGLINDDMTWMIIYIVIGG